MNGILTSNEVGWALMQAGLSPFTLDTEMFQIVREGENYIIHTDRLPEIYSLEHWKAYSSSWSRLSRHSVMPVKWLYGMKQRIRCHN